MKEIRAECSLTEKQYRNYMTFHVLGKKKEQLIHLTLCLLVLLFGLSNFRADSPILGWLFTIAAVYLFISRYLRFVISVNRITEEYGLTQEPKYFYTIVFQDTSFQVRNLKETARYQWGDVFHVYIMKQRQMIYLYMNKQTAFLIPMEGISFGSDSDVQKLQEYFSQKIADEKITVRES